MRFEDGPLSRRGNVSTVASRVAGQPVALGDTVVARTLFGWPLPDRLGVLCHEIEENVALWDADDPACSGLPPIIAESPNAVVYRKVEQSELQDDSMTNVMRGALYRLEDQ